jgi:NADPH:quinone reductase
MKAILVKESNLIVTDYAKPEVKNGFVLIKNQAFGINRAEVYMRKGEFGPTHDIIGIEFAGIVENDLSGTYNQGQKVVAFVGGMARENGGSYAEYVSVPLQNVIPIETNLLWNELAAIPETFATAWAILHKALKAQSGQTILVRGGTSTLGLGVIVLAKQFGLTVIATSRNEIKFEILKKYGADYTIVDNGNCTESVRNVFPKGVSNVVELIGSTTLNDSLTSTSVGGTVCVSGFLGGLVPIENFMALMHIPSTVKLTSFGSAFVFGNKDFPFSEIPLQKIVSDIEQKTIPNILAKTVTFDEIVLAHQLMESNTINGKIVVTL